MDVGILLAIIGDKEVTIYQLRQRVAELEAQHVAGKVDSGLQPGGSSSEAGEPV